MDAAGRERRPQDEPPCIWVLSGVLNYHICDRDYDCEGCELYAALSGKSRGLTEKTLPMLRDDVPRTATPEGQVAAHLAQLLAGCRLYLDRPYRPPHFWLVSSGPDRVTLGLDGALMRMLRPIRRVVSPGVGLHLDRDQPCGWIARDHLAVPLRMPIAGEVIDTNPAFAQSGEPCRLPEGEDWLFTVRPSEPLEEVPGIVGAEETLAWYADRMRTVKQAILSAVQSPDTNGVGPAMADGGVPQTTLEGVLGREAFESLIWRIATDDAVRPPSRARG